MKPRVCNYIGGWGLGVDHGPKELLQVGRALGALSHLPLDAGGVAINLSPLASTFPLIWAISMKPEFYEISFLVLIYILSSEAAQQDCVCGCVCTLMYVYVCAMGRGYHYSVLKYKPRVISTDTHTHTHLCLPQHLPESYLSWAWEGGVLGQAGIRVLQTRET